MVPQLVWGSENGGTQMYPQIIQVIRPILVLKQAWRLGAPSF